MRHLQVSVQCLMVLMVIFHAKGTHSTTKPTTNRPPTLIPGLELVSQLDIAKLLDQFFVTSETYLVGGGLTRSRYYLSKMYMSQSEAQAACGGIGGSLAEVTSVREFNFLREFLRTRVVGISPVTISGFSAYRRPVPEDFRSTYDVNMTSQIDDAVHVGRLDRPLDPEMDGGQFPLYLDFFPDRPRVVSEPPSCLGIVHRHWKRPVDRVRMSNDKCLNRYRFLCEVQMY